jgi:hypothetical protein
MAIQFETQDAMWATDDGSFGSGRVVLVDTSKWSKKQWGWFEILENAGDVYAEDLAQIDKGIMPERLED